MSEEEKKKYRNRKIVTVIVMGILVLIFGFIGLLQLNSLKRTPTSERTEAINSNIPTIVMFYSKTCPDCKRVIGTVKLARFKSYGNPTRQDYGVAFVEVNTPDDKDLVNQYHITKTPTFMIFKNGQPQAIGSANGFDVFQYAGPDKEQIKSLYTNLVLKQGGDSQ